MNEMDDALFEDKISDLVLLAGEEEFTDPFLAGFQTLLEETQRAVEFAMTAADFSAVKVCINPLRQLLQAQTEFLEKLKEKILREIWPASPPAGEEVLN